LDKKEDESDPDEYDRLYQRDPQGSRKMIQDQMKHQVQQIAGRRQRGPVCRFVSIKG
jgi:hypothetical protein